MKCTSKSSQSSNPNSLKCGVFLYYMVRSNVFNVKFCSMFMRNQFYLLGWPDDKHAVLGNIL